MDTLTLFYQIIFCLLQLCDIIACNGYCFNNGICTLAAAAKDPPTCECDKAFYEGPRCNIRVTTTAPPTIPAADTTTSELCASYQQFCITGTCILESGRPKCQCPSTYTGEYCDTAVGGGVVPPGMYFQSNRTEFSKAFISFL